MYCPECGEKLITPNQKFCHNCGTKVITIPITTDYKTERIQNVRSTETYYTPIKQQPRVQKGLPGKYSKMSLGCALASIIIGIVSLIIGYNYYRLIYSPNGIFLGRIVVMIGILLLRVGGLILGVYSKISSSKAEMYEPYNDIEKAGSVFGILGIVTNAIGLFLSFFGPWSIFYFPSY